MREDGHVKRTSSKHVPADGRVKVELIIKLYTFLTSEWNGLFQFHYRSESLFGDFATFAETETFLVGGEAHARIEY